MRYAACILLFLVVCRHAAAADVEIPLHDGSVVRLATVEEGAAILGTSDRFTSVLSPFDLQSRLATDEPVTENDLLRLASAQVLPWKDEHRERIAAALAAIRPRLEGIGRMFPDVVPLIRTTGKEEGGAAYCRGGAIVLPDAVLGRSQRGLERLLEHELFHILSRHNPELRAKLYAIVGFRPCGEIELPASLKDRKITNPDAPTLDYYIELETDGKKVAAVPVLYASIERYDAARGGSFFRYMVFRLLVVHKEGDTWRAALDDEGQPLLIDPDDNESYHEQIGRNTRYIIHPEEVLADNFVHLVEGAENLATPRIVEEMKALLAPRE